MKWVKVCCLGLASCVVSLALVKTVGAKPELSALSCSSQADSFGLALLAKVFTEDGLIGPPGPDGFFSYDSMGPGPQFFVQGRWNRRISQGDTPDVSGEGPGVASCSRSLLGPDLR